MNEDAPIDVDADDSDVVPMEVLDDTEDRPIMLLFKQLVTNDNTKTTVLTNAEIFDILNKEFDINVPVMDELEVEIYLSVMKKYLKSWPKWNQFDSIISRLKAPSCRKLLKITLEDWYKLLKEYLNKILAITKPLAEEAVKEMSVTTSASTTTKENESQDVILEVVCSREQLNQLFFRQPKGGLSTNIFNITKNIQNKIILKQWDIESILNMWNVRVFIHLSSLIYKREMNLKLNHVLINKKRGISTQIETLDTRLQEKYTKAKDFDKTLLLRNLVNILRMYTNNIEVYTLLSHVFSMLEKDFNQAPDTLNVPAKYRQYLSKYPYVRYLYADENDASTSTNAEQYDLQLQETVYPMCEYYIKKVDYQESLLPPFQDWFKIECGICKIKFKGVDMINEINNHFNDHHNSEPDWECTNCKLKFDMRQITEARWSHICSS